MINTTEMFRRYKTYSDAVGCDDPVTPSYSQQSSLRHGVARIASLTGGGQYTITEQIYTPTGYQDPPGDFYLADEQAFDYMGRNFGYVGKKVRFWQVRKNDGQIVTMLDLNGHADVWTARIINPVIDLAGGHGLNGLPIAGTGKPSGFYVDEVDPSTLESFYPSRTRDGNNGYITTEAHNLAINPSGNMHPNSLSLRWMPLPMGTIIQVQTVNYPSDMGCPPYLRHLFHFAQPPWPVKILTDKITSGRWRCDFENGVSASALEISFVSGANPSSFGALYPTPRTDNITLVVCNVSGISCSTGTGGVYYYEVISRIPLSNYSTMDSGDKEVITSETASFGKLFTNN